MRTFPRPGGPSRQCRDADEWASLVEGAGFSSTPWVTDGRLAAPTTSNLILARR
jgi:hypothetical protein